MTESLPARPTPDAAPASQAPHPLAVQVRGAIPVAGYLPGMAQACVLVELALGTRVSRQGIEALDSMMAQSWHSALQLLPSVQSHPALGRVVAGTVATLEQAACPSWCGR